MPPLPPLLLSTETHRAYQRVRSQAKRHWTRSKGHRLAWWAWGERATSAPLILFPGGFGSWRHWFRNVESLAERHPVWCVELPGLGDSDDAPTARPTVEELTEPVLAGISTLFPAASALHLAAFSFGGVIAAEVSARLGSRARSLVICGTGALGLPSDPLPKACPVRPDMSVDALERAHRSNLGALMFRRASRIDELAVYLEHESVTRSRLRYSHLLTGDALSQSLRRQSAKLTGIYGRHDPFHAPDVAARGRHIVETQAAASFHLVEDASHWAIYECASQCNLLLGRSMNDAFRGGAP